MRETFVGADGSFAFQYVTAGAYLVEIDPQGNGGDKLSISYQTLTAPLQVEGDMSGLTYALTPAKSQPASPVR